MRVYVYAIAKNEAAFAERWAASMAEADGVFVLDTGSTDGTPALLRALGCQVTEAEITPWRFDAARNRSLKLPPADADVLVCTDLDEWFRPGWRAALEGAWRPGAAAGRCEYVWSFGPDGGPGVTFFCQKIHAPGVCRWKYPVHEVLDCGGGQVCLLPLRLEHYPDPAKSRGDYLHLLELAVAEAPEDARCRHYLGREYMFRGAWRAAIRTLREHLALPSAVWAAERAESMRYLARCHGALGEAEAEELWLLRAALEAPLRREAWVELGTRSFERGDWRGCVRYLEQALSIRRRDLSYTTEPEAWGPGPWERLAAAYDRLGDGEAARLCGAEAARAAN